MITSAIALAASLLWQAPAVSPGAPPASAGQPATLTTASGTIHGTLVVPEAAGKVPIVLVIAGSGPTDRDGNPAQLPGKNNAYKLLAEALAAEGVASLRYDKRGVGQSRAAGGSEANLRFEMYADDAAAWVTQLRADARFSRVIVVGHSEGSLIGMLATEQAKADAFVSIAGPARRASTVLRDQLRPQLSTVPALWQGSETVLSSLDAGVAVDPLPMVVQSVPAVANLYRPSVQPYLISWFKYVPSAKLAALRVPVLILQGTTDIQVNVDEAKGLKAAKPDAELILIEGMNHVMKRAPVDFAQNYATYSNPDLPIVPDVPNAIVALARRLAR